MTRIRAFYAALPRAGKWLVWLVAFVAGFIIINDGVLTWHDRWTQRADVLETRLRRLRELGDVSSEQGRVIATRMTNFGRPALPSSSTQVAESLTRRINYVFDDAGIDDRTQTEKSASFKAKGSDARVDRVIIEVTFEADPRTVASILAALESAPEVTTISRARIDKQNAGYSGGRNGGSASSGSRGGLVRATLAVEGWANPEGRR